MLVKVAPPSIHLNSYVGRCCIQGPSLGRSGSSTPSRSALRRCQAGCRSNLRPRAGNTRPCGRRCDLKTNKLGINADSKTFLSGKNPNAEPSASPRTSRLWSFIWWISLVYSSWKFVNLFLASNYFFTPSQTNRTSWNTIRAKCYVLSFQLSEGLQSHRSFSKTVVWHWRDLLLNPGRCCIWFDLTVWSESELNI